MVLGERAPRYAVTFMLFPLLMESKPDTYLVRAKKYVQGIQYKNVYTKLYVTMSP